MLDALVAEARLRWGLDPAAGLQVVASEWLVATPIEPSRPVLLVPLALLNGRARGGPARGGRARGGRAGSGAGGPATLPEPEPLPGRHGPRGHDPIAVLQRLYPGAHPVGRAGLPDGTTIGELAAEELLGPLYLAPVDASVAQASPWAMPAISDRLRRPDGCPWDREQTHESLRKHLLEEAYEVYDALAGGATPELAEELGDLLLQIVLHAQLAAEEGVFDLTDVQSAIGAKIVRRHPHVFGDATVHTASDVNRQWEQIKKAERAAAAASAPGSAMPGPDASDAGGELDSGLDDTRAVPPRSALDGIPRSMPALAATQEMQERAAHLGYDWPTIDGVVAKVHEELQELLAAHTPEELHEEVGDLLLVVVNLARKEGVEAESALRSAGEKFRRRFRSVERQAAARNVALRDLDFAQLDELWMAAKAEERSQ